MIRHRFAPKGHKAIKKNTGETICLVHKYNLTQPVEQLCPMVNLNEAHTDQFLSNRSDVFYSAVCLALRSWFVVG